MTGGLTELRAIMQHFRRFLPNDLPLRPLLFAAGAAATAAGVYIVRKKKKRDDQERTVHTSVSQDPVQNPKVNSLLDFGCSCDNHEEASVTPTPRSAPKEDALAKAERELERREKSELMSRIDKLQSKEHELENLIHMSIAECGKNCKVNLAEMERKYEEVMDTNTQLVVDTFTLKSEVTILKDTVAELKEALSATNLICNKLISERDLMTHVKSKEDKMTQTPSYDKKSLSVTLEEVKLKYKPVMKSSGLWDNILEDLGQQMEGLRLQ